MEDIYIVLTYSGTILSRLIKIYTRKKYSHVSISLDKDLDKMYSFGRLNAYNPFIGGFVKESIKFGTFKRFNKADTLIYELKVDKDQFDRINNELEQFIKEKEKYKFNFIGLVGAGFNLRLKRRNSYYCAEFVKHLIDNSDLDLNLPEVIKPDDFRKIKNKNMIFEGKLCDYYSKQAINT